MATTDNPVGKAGAARGNGAVTPAANLLPARRLIPTFDIGRQTGVEPLPAPILETAALQQSLTQSVTHFYAGLTALKVHIDALKSILPSTLLPPTVSGSVLNPDKSGAGLLSVEAQLPSPGLGSQPVHTLTNDDGTFLLALPAATTLAQGDQLALVVHGANGSATFKIDPAKIASTGLIPALQLQQFLAPLPTSIIAGLKALVGGATALAGTSSQSAAVNLPVVRIGEDGVCGQLFGTDASEDRFRFSVMFRLVQPRTSILTRTVRFPYGAGDRQNYLNIAARSSQWVGGNGAGGGATYGFVDRVAVDQPISVDGFRDELSGLANGQIVTGDETVPMAGTLGLGYVVEMAQRWTPLGVTLGNLVYSLPLAPGEQQRVAVFERRDETAVVESESLDITEQQAFEQQQDTSAQATFDQAFSESARGGSSFQTVATSASAGFNILIASGGGGVATTSGSQNSWMEGQRHTASSAAEQTHAEVERQAAARRSAQRTSMRLASASESEDVTTKVVTNHNHTRALTLQYWEVHRLYDVTTAVDGVQLVCMVPLEVIRWLYPGQPATLNNTVAAGSLQSRAEVLLRYAQLLRHADILQPALPFQFRYGLGLLNEFAADPRAMFDPNQSATAEDIVEINITGTFLPMEDVYVTAVTRRGTRVGPIPMDNSSVQALPDQPDSSGKINFANAFSSDDELFGYLRERRQDTRQDATLTASLALPPSLARTDIVGFEISRRWHVFDHWLVDPALKAAAVTGELTPTAGIQIGPFTIGGGRMGRYVPAALEDQCHGPLVWNFNATINASSTSAESYATNAIAAPVDLPPTGYPIAAREVAPVLTFSALLQIEKTLQHVVRNTVRYSEFVWISLSPEERAIMLEGFTIGVSSGGVQDDTQEVPLLNCVSNQVLGFYGNCMIMPFIIPKEVAEAEQFSSADVEKALTNFHRSGFAPPHSRIALPTRGVLGEAVLGHCASAERIDLTRFWNWQDSPADSATTIADVTVPTTTPSIAAGLTGPSALPGIAPLITNFNNSPPIPVDTSLVGSLASAAAAQKDFTGLISADALAGLLKTSQQTAESARADALKRATELQSQAMTEVGNFFGATGGEAYAANYRDPGSGGSDSGSSDSGGQKKGNATKNGGNKTPSSKGTGTKGSGHDAGGNPSPDAGGTPDPAGDGGAGGVFV